MVTNHRGKGWPTAISVAGSSRLSKSMLQHHDTSWTSMVLIMLYDVLWYLMALLKCSVVLTVQNYRWYHAVWWRPDLTKRYHSMMLTVHLMPIYPWDRRGELVLVHSNHPNLIHDLLISRHATPVHVNPHLIGGSLTLQSVSFSALSHFYQPSQLPNLQAPSTPQIAAMASGHMGGNSWGMAGQAAVYASFARRFGSHQASANHTWLVRFTQKNIRVNQTSNIPKSLG